MNAQRKAAPPDTKAPSDPPLWRKWAPAAALYLAVVALAAGVDGELVLPALALVAVAFPAYEVLYPGHRWRHPAGAVVAALLLVPALFVVAHGSWWLVASMALPALVLLVLRRRGPRSFRRWWAARAELGSLLYLGAVAVLVGWGNGRLSPPLNDDALFRLYAAPQTFHLTQPEIEAAASTVQRALEGYDPGAPDAVPAAVQDQAAGLPAVLRAKHERDVHVTLWLDAKPFVRGSAKGGLLHEDLARATAQALGRADEPGQWVSRSQEVRFMVDVADAPVAIGSRPSHKLTLAAMTLLSRVGNRTLRASRWLSQLSYEIEPGVDGVLLRAGDRTGGFLPGDPVIRGWLSPRVRGRVDKIERLMTEMSRDAGGPDDLWQRHDAVIYKFRSFSFGRPAAKTGQAARRLYRANVLLDSVDSEAILEGIAEVARWLAVAVGPDGKFDYEYLPNVDASTDDYNVVRHAGCVYGLFHVYRMALREPRLRPHANDYLEGAIRAMSWVYRDLGKPRGARDDQMIAFLGPGGVATSGASALTLLTFLERPRQDMVSHPVLAEQLERPGDAQLIEGLGRFLLGMIDQRGRVFTHYDERLGADEVDKEPLYYPGETMLALARLYNATTDPRWLEAAQRIADHRVERYFEELHNPDHWVM